MGYGGMTATTERTPVIRRALAMGTPAVPTVLRGASHSEDMSFRMPIHGSVATSLAKNRAKFFNGRLGQKARLGQTEADSGLTFYNFYHDLIVPIMNAACQSEANTQQCASFNVQLQQIENSLSQALANNDIGALIIAGISMKSLYDDVKDTLNPDAPPPVNPPPVPPQPPSSTGIPTWLYILGGIIVIGAGTATVVALTRK